MKIFKKVGLHTDPTGKQRLIEHVLPFATALVAAWTVETNVVRFAYPLLRVPMFVIETHLNTNPQMMMKMKDGTERL